MRVRLIPWCLVALLWATAASAQTAITPQPVVVTATFNTLSVRAPFAAGTDSNANATVAIQFRASPSGAFMNAYAPYIDRRATVGGTSNPHQNEARVAIVGLAPNTAWDVKVTWTDPDGVTGGQPAIVPVSTLTKTPPTGSGTTRNITDNTTQASALAAANAGDTLLWAAGTYTNFTFSRNGTSGAWIVLDGQNQATIAGTGTNQNIALNANFVIVKNFILSASDFNGIVVGSGQSNVFVQGNTVQGFSHLCSPSDTGCTGSHCGDSGIDVRGGDHIYVMSNTVNGDAALAACRQPVAFNGPGMGIHYTACTTCVIDGNTIVGNDARDGMSADNSNDALVNVDIVGNTVSGYGDDGVEFKGQNLNVRVWANVITTDRNPFTCIAGNTNSPTTIPAYGPVYVFRNTCRSPSGNGTPANSGAPNATYKVNSAAPMYYFHNSMDSSAGTGNMDGFAPDASNTAAFIALDNIMKSKGSSIDKAVAAASTFDYDDLLVTGASSFTFLWDGSTSYATWAAFKTGTNQESHGVNGDPAFTDTDLHIPTGSPAKDAGTVINNFDSLDSAWPYAGTAPDMGAWEFGASWSTLRGTPITGGAGPAPPGAPTNFTIAGL